MISHLLDIIGPRASVIDQWIGQVTVNAMLSALELENDITVLQYPFPTVLLVDLAADDLCANQLLSLGTTGICLQNVGGSALCNTFIKLFKETQSVPTEGDFNDIRAIELRFIETNMDLALLPRANAISGGLCCVHLCVLL
jgi:hypothetical protein